MCDEMMQEIDRTMEELNALSAEIERDCKTFEQASAEYDTYKALEKQLAENPPNADAIKQKMQAIEKHIEALAATIKPVVAKEKTNV